MTPEERSEAIQALGGQLGIFILEDILRYEGDPNEYMFIVSGVKVPLGPLSKISRQRVFRLTVLEHLKVLPLEVPAKNWEGILAQIVALAHPVGIGEGQDTEWVKDTLGAYLESNRPVSKEEDSEAWGDYYRLSAPIIRDDAIHISLPHFISWVRAARGRRITERQMAVLLSYLGASPVEFTERTPLGRYHRRYWRLPPGLVTLPELEEQQQEEDKDEIIW